MSDSRLSIFYQICQFTGKEVTCPKGIAFVSCPFNPCNQPCELFPNAKCEVNQCGTCEAKYTNSNNETVNCFRPGKADILKLVYTKLCK